MKKYVVIKPSDVVCIGVVTLFLLAACVAGTMEYGDTERQQQLYCDMYKIFQESDGMYGWPDYNLNAKEICDA
jgi:hypothetical protein